MSTNFDNIVIGRDVPLSKVLADLKTKGTFNQFREKLAGIVISLESDMDHFSNLRQALILGTKDLDAVVHEVLKTWISNHSERATLNTLIKALEDNGMKDCAEPLKLLKITISSERRPINNVTSQDLPDAPNMDMEVADS